MKKIIFVYCIFQAINILPCEYSTIDMQLLKKQISDFFTTFIKKQRDKNSTIKSFISNNKDDFKIYVKIYKIKTKNSVLQQSDGLDFIFERNLIQGTINDLYEQAHIIDTENNNTCVHDFLVRISELKDEF